MIQPEHKMWQVVKYSDLPENLTEGYGNYDKGVYLEIDMVEPLYALEKWMIANIEGIEGKTILIHIDV